MKILKHLNIVKLLEVINIEETLFIVMEYLSGGNLFTYLEAKNGLKEREAQDAFHQLVLALQHCHQQGMVRWDLKLSSLLLDANNNVNILDFGLSKHWHPRKKLDTFCVSPCSLPQNSSWAALHRPRGGCVEPQHRP